MDGLKSTVIKLLEDNHICKGSRKWRDYENAKFYLEELDLDSIEYHDACQIIAEYIGVKVDKPGTL
jgi:viroplasmin and RNaseH domain-containing protein